MAEASYIRSQWWFCGGLVAGLLLVPGCWKGVDELGGDAGGDASGSAGDGAEGGDTDGGPASELPAPTTRFFRLTHPQWENTVRDLFYLDDHTGLSTAFRADANEGGFIFDNNALAHEVDGALWSGYQRAAADMAEMAIADQAILDGILPPDQGDAAARTRDFLTLFVRRAYRRPATDQELALFTTRFGEAADLYPGVDPFLAGVRLTIETVLQSPYFLYRVEHSTEVVGEVIPLDQWELAQRMSYFLWNTMPDDALFDAAEQGVLSNKDEIEVEARRMLADARARDVASSFHNQLLEIDKVLEIAPNPAFYPDAPAGLGQAAVEENDLFVRDVMFDRDGTYADLLTSPETYVNADLAQVYGVAGSFDDQLVPASLDASQRAGLFTQVAFLAINATSSDPDPIHRGVFLARHITCTDLPAPPDNVPKLPTPDGTKTNRQLVEEHTSDAACAGCHAGIINPYGFAFENYDAVGAWRTEDRGFPVDAASEVLMGNDLVPVDNALDLAGVLADSPITHECYLEHWIEFANSRPSAPEDRGIKTRLAAASQEDMDSIQDILVKLIISQPFRSRSTEELQ